MDEKEAIDNANRVQFLTNGLREIVDLIEQWDRLGVDTVEMRRLRRLHWVAQSTIDDAEKWYGAEQRETV